MAGLMLFLISSIFKNGTDTHQVRKKLTRLKGDDTKAAVTDINEGRRHECCQQSNPGLLLKNPICR